MKYFATHFSDYIKSSNNNSLHPKLLEIYNKFPSNIENLQNIILTGPSGSGKYTQMLEIVKKYSQSNLKYEKKFSIQYNKILYYFKMSDIHFEIDMSLLGCNSKIIWNEIYLNILDILLSRQNKSGIIVCKYFQYIHMELLEIFYSYMQSLKLDFINLKHINLKFILLTENISFIPNNILDSCLILNVPRPSKTQYNKCLKKKINIDIKDINNIKNVLSNVKNINPYDYFSNQLINNIINIDSIKLIDIRDKLYDIFIYNLDVIDTIWYILIYLITNNHIKEKYINDILIKTYKFLLYYNNNYRPIYHLENYVFYLISIVNEFDKVL